LFELKKEIEKKVGRDENAGRQKEGMRNAVRDAIASWHCVCHHRYVWGGSFYALAAQSFITQRTKAQPPQTPILRG
jgi:hypothetical protein